MNLILDKLHLAMTEKGIDGLWLSSTENYRYASGFYNPDGRMFITKGKSYVFADFRYIEDARAKVYSGYEVVMPEGRIISGLMSGLVEENTVKVIGYEENTLVCSELDALKKSLPGCEFVPAGELFNTLRSCKSDYEIESIKAAQLITDAAFEHILKVIKYDMTELDVAAELEYFMKKNGAEDKSFDTIAVSGSNSSSPHGVPRPLKLERGFLTMDFGAIVNRYHSDMTRTIVIGRADVEMKRLYNTVLDAQQAVLEIITEGAENYQMDKVARDIIDKAGYEGCFGHSLGHGVGLEIHEMPGLSPKCEGTLLIAGNVVTVEPGIYIEGKYGCRIEDMVVITLGGATNITHSRKELIEI